MPVFDMDDGIFSGHFNVTGPWSDSLPGFGFSQVLSIDPAAVLERATKGQLQQAAGGTKVNVTKIPPALAGYLNELAGYNFVTAVRDVVGFTATTVGVLIDQVRHVENTFAEGLRTAVLAVDTLSGIVNSDTFQEAIDGIAWIPIVGWIIKILAEILELALQITTHVIQKRIDSMNKDLAQRFLLPLYKPSEHANTHQELIVRSMLANIRDGYIESIFLPRFAARDFADYNGFVAKAAGYTEWDMEPGEKGRAARWYLTSEQLGAALGVPIGFVPGTSLLLNALEFQVGHCGAMPRNIGDYLVTAKGMSAYTWQLLQREEPGMFSVRADVVKREWINYVSSGLLFAVESVAKGYTCSPTAKFDSDKEYDESKGKKVRIPSGHNHGDEYVQWLVKNFWGRGANLNSYPLPVRDSSKDESWPDNFYYENMVSSVACDRLKAAQEAMLKGPKAFYVHGEQGVTINQRPNMTPYPAIAYDSAMKALWERSVTDMLNQMPTGWLQNNVHLSDVPKQSPLYPILAQKGIPQFPSPAAGGGQLATPGPYGDPKPPKPPEQTGTGTRLSAPKGKKKPKSEMSTPQKIAAGAAVAGMGYIGWRVATGRKVFSFGKK